MEGCDDDTPGGVLLREWGALGIVSWDVGFNSAIKRKAKRTFSLTQAYRQQRATIPAIRSAINWGPIGSAGTSFQRQEQVSSYRYHRWATFFESGIRKTSIHVSNYIFAFCE